jgi:hypothetical protein
MNLGTVQDLLPSNGPAKPVDSKDKVEIPKPSSAVAQQKTESKYLLVVAKRSNMIMRRILKLAILMKRLCSPMMACRLVGPNPMMLSNKQKSISVPLLIQ